MKNSILLTLVLITITASFNSCKKDKEEDVVATPKTKMQLLCGKNWKLTAEICDPAIDWNGSGAVSTNVYNQMQSCETDDITIFNTNGTYTNDEGVSKCNATDPQTITGSWVFNINETIITVTKSDATTYSYNIISLNETTFVLSVSEVINSVNYTLTATYTKQ